MLKQPSLKFLEIAAQTYRQHVARRSFIFFTFIAPIVGVLLFCGLTVWLTPSSENTMRVGMVDESGFFTRQPTVKANTEFELKRFDTVTAAEAAWRAGTLDGYFVVAHDYLETGQVQLVSRFGRNPFLHDYIEQFLRAQLLDKTTPDAQARILEGTSISHSALQQSNPPDFSRALNTLLAAGLVALFLILNQFTQNYLWQAVNAEHENRTIEIVLSSVSLSEFFAGKVLGIALTGLTPLVVWGSVFGILLALGLQLGALFGISFGAWSGWNILIAAFLVLLPAYLIGALTTLLFGALTNQLLESQSLPWFLDLLQVILFFPLILIALLTPDSALAVVLGLLPWTAPVVLILRLGLTDVPLWQIAVAVSLQWLSFWVLIRLSERVYTMTRNGNVPWRAWLGLKT